MAERIKLTLQDIRIIDRYSSKFLSAHIEDINRTASAMRNPVSMRADLINIHKENEKIV